MAIQDLLLHWKESLPGDHFLRKYAGEKPPLRSDLYTADQMAHYGKSLAARHQLSTGRGPNQLLKRLSENEELLQEVQDLLTDSVKAGRRIIPAGEWLLDNFYLIRDQIRTGEKHLPKGYSEDLPRLLNGPSAGLPRVYDIALEIVSHSDGRIDLQGLSQFIASYQQVTTLKLGELWAIPIMLRLALIENLRRLAAQIALDRINQDLADYWADQMIEVTEKDPKSLILVIADMARSEPPMVSSFVAELTRMLQGKGPSLALPLNWIDQRLSESGQTSNELVQLEFQKQAADQVSMSNSIGSLRFLGTTDWREFVEKASLVEATLRQDASGTYPQMDFTTRDTYRHIVEKIARFSQVAETDVAAMALALSKSVPTQDRRSHIGYYLIDKGRKQLEKEAKTKPPLSDRFERLVLSYPLFCYLGSIFVLTAFIAGGFLTHSYRNGLHGWPLAGLGFLSVLCTSQLAVSIVNWTIPLFIQPKPLPRMNFSQGIADDCKTLLAVPTLFNTESEFEVLLEELEVRYLANRDPHLHFALLTDFTDATSETLPEDEALLEFARQRVEALNEKYGVIDNSLFMLMHRPRRWNAREKSWMGYERKRGKLTELNGLLRGKGRDRYSLIVASADLFPQIKYVITLDSDTQMPRDAAKKIVATIAHPLNRAVYNEQKHRVTDGYGILQPRVDISLEGAARSRYAKLHGTDLGIDPYTLASSDVYQDLFCEGSFIGKGIYEVDVFSRGLDDRFPDNRILSHDLLEGSYLRSGLISDISLYEEYPARYSEDVQRRHRWIRGDWQIGTWALPFVPDATGRLRRNPLSSLSRWKILDNLRRSLIPPASILLLILGWTVLQDAIFWTLSVILLIIFPPLIITVWNILNKPEEISLRQHLGDSIDSIRNYLAQVAFTIICLPYEAWYSLDAILRTNWRMIFSHRKLLEWNPSRNVRNGHSDNAWTFMRRMWIAPAVSIIMLFYLGIVNPINVITTFILLGFWATSPAIAWWISVPLDGVRSGLSQDQLRFLRRLARKTWSFFETFVNEEDNWLPPDNYQEHPVERTAHRTSPTNIGLALMANLSAWDFGYITTGTFIDRSNGTFENMAKLEKFRGHFYNWYDTSTLQPLPPRYISTVDSGNLSGHLMTLRQGILAMPFQPIFHAGSIRGLQDTAGLVEAEIRERQRLRDIQGELAQAFEVEPTTVKSAMVLLEGLSVSVSNWIGSSDADSESELSRWLGALQAQIIAQKDALSQLAPWLALPAAPPGMEELLPDGAIPSLQDLVLLPQIWLPRIAHAEKEAGAGEVSEWANRLRSSINHAAQVARQQMDQLEVLSAQCLSFAETEYEFLFDKAQKLMTIGYNVEEHRRDAGYYDLMASEARLGIFVGIAAGKLPQEAWFALGRQLTNIGGSSILVSWSGSMFEYLMPRLVMPEYEHTLLDQTNKGMIQVQIDYGKQRNVPWGISESGYNLVDSRLNYQYRAFGVPGLGLKRGLAEDLVIAPYSSVMALMVAPEEACTNLQTMVDDGYMGRYGLFEAVDYTSSRLPRGQSEVVIRSFMVHHQGMSLLSLAYLLLDQPMQKRFTADLTFQATLLLMQERIPKATGFYSPPTDIADTGVTTAEPDMRVINTPDTPVPEVQLLSNGRYHVMVTNAGGGYSRWKDLAVTRWREDCTCDDWGSFCYIRDLENAVFWSTGFQPAQRQAKSYEAVFSQGRAEFRRRDNDIETHTEIAVSPEDDIEVRRVHLTNRSRKKRIIEITSYAEVVLNTQPADALHQAFSNLFVETSILPDREAILCTRRPRSAGEQVPWMFHLMKAQGEDGKEVSYETDRLQFIGRGNTLADPQALHQGSLSNTEGPVLDPIVSIRFRITLNPQQSITIDMAYGMAETKELCLGLIERYQDRHLMDRVFELAWTHSQVALRQINATEADAQLYGRMAGSIIYANAALRADPAVLVRNQRGQSGLWSYSISGDLPIVLVQIEDPANIEIAKQMIQAHAYWRQKGLIADLVIWNEDHGGYRQSLQNQLLGLISSGLETDMADRPGGVFVRVADQISAEDRILLQTVARIRIADDIGDLAYQVNKRNIVRTPIARLVPRQPYFPQAEKNVAIQADKDLQYFNGLGGFSADGREYIIQTSRKQTTPLPWVNVLANLHFGTVISESGQSYTWADNAHEFRLSPWCNDPVSDPSGEAFYIRDEETSIAWSPTPLPARGKNNYITRHGFGYTIFEYAEDGIRSDMQVFVDLEAPVKYTVIKLSNHSGRERKLSLTGYVEWVLGDLRSKTGMHVLSSVDALTGALLARNPYHMEFGGKVCFFDADAETRSYTADRAEFIGRNGSLRYPDALTRVKLSGKTGAALDPCGAIQVTIDLPDGADKEIIFLLGSAGSLQEAGDTVRKYRGRDAAANALEKIQAYWQKTTGALQVESPEPSLNIMANGWLLYQTLTCRIRARSGYYQSGGAFGYRDQLQDCLAVLQTEPAMVREHILLCATRQFRDGDVQHWWHPPTGRGVRTRCSDDFLWLPYVTGRYIEHTGDLEVLKETAAFLEGRQLNPEEESYYDLPQRSDYSGTLYEHCVQAIRHGCRFGSHGIPLMGSGDWNDGMDKVGIHGKGESIWLGFFLYTVLTGFSEIARRHGDAVFEAECRQQAEQLKNNLNQHGWDGEWYRRAYFDDGQPLGSHENDECRIDSISQSWSVLSGAGVPEYTQKGMESASQHLVRRDIGIIQLLDPPFDKSQMDPGYIKGYVPGVRENGGQYTHAAIWLTMAFAAMGDRTRAWELFNMINPIHHGDSMAKTAVYKVEPYVMAADIYSIAQHTGRGGWTWYTGSAGWMYQLITGALLGLHRDGDRLRFAPCVPGQWEPFTIRYRYQSSLYLIKYVPQGNGAGGGAMKVTLDGQGQVGDHIGLVDDGKEHAVEVLV